MNDFFSVAALFIIFIIIIITFYNIYNSQIEGMTNKKNNDKTSSINNTSRGINSTTFHEKLKEHHLNLKSDLNIPKHRNDYENILIEMNDYVDGLMLSEVLNVDPNNITNSKLMNTVQNITKMNQSKESLNKIMKYLDNN
jgi:uncharacterized membrane protein YhiD involved in acid resistance